MSILMMLLMSVSSLFLIILILLQRGRGGGLAGALGGAGGQSALGTKAGDAFTKITVVMASVWIFLCVVAVKTLPNAGTGELGEMGGNAPAVTQEAEGEPGMGAPAPAGPKDVPNDGNTGGAEGEAPAPATTAPPADE